MKDGNYLRASDIFEIILGEFKNSKFQEEARLGLGDTCFLRGDFTKAQDCYQGLLSSNPNTRLKAQIYYRLSQVGFRKGDTQFAKGYLEKLKQDFPANLELKSDKDLGVIPADVSSEVFYTVQVGSFANISNARNLTQKLTQAGYPAYIEEFASSQTGKTYRVRVGKLRQRQEAVELENKLSQEGYPTKICP
jgi:tetratricopeptide (TPR) repeat protein